MEQLHPCTMYLQQEHDSSFVSGPMHSMPDTVLHLVVQLAFVAVVQTAFSLVVTHLSWSRASQHKAHSIITASAGLIQVQLQQAVGTLLYCSSSLQQVSAVWSGNNL